MSAAEAEDEVRRRVAARLAGLLDGEVKNLSAVRGVRGELQQQLTQLDEKLSVASTNTPSQLHASLATCADLSSKVSGLAGRREALLAKSADAAEQSRRFGEENSELLADISVVRGVVQYSVWIQLIQQLSSQLEEAAAQEDMRDCLSNFEKLREVHTALKSSKCVHLRNYGGAMVSHWYKIIHDKMVSEMEGVLQSLSWPFVQMDDLASLKTLSSTAESTERLHELTRLLLLLQEPDTPSLPMKVMLRPIKKRFRFHFLGSKATNNPTKPEWYLTQLVNWAAAHKPFLEQHVQPVYDEAGLGMPVVLEFGEALVGLAVEKLEIDLPLVMDDDVLLAHTIDEVIGLVRDFSNKLEYSSAQPSPLAPVTQAVIFNRWLDMERKFAFEKVETVLRGEDAWESEAGGLAPKAAHSFLALLLSVTERYKFLAKVEHRLQFLKLQIDLLEDFRLRLVQLARTEQEAPLSSNLCPILNTIDHVVDVIANWAETPFFLQLENHKCQIEETEMTGTVFDKTIHKYEYLKEDLTNCLVEAISYETKANSRAYRRDTKWFSLPPEASSVTAAACGMLQTLAFHLETVRHKVEAGVFGRVRRGLVLCMTRFVCDELVLCNKFNAGGVAQLRMDLTLGLFPIFGEFTAKPETYFIEVLDYLKLLELPVGAAHLLLQTLEADTTGFGSFNTLKELGIVQIDRDAALKVLRVRIDLS